jgi:hypothetical protein
LAAITGCANILVAAAWLRSQAAQCAGALRSYWHFAVDKLPDVNLYWSSDPFFRVQEIADVMPTKRLKKILSNLHVNDNSNLPKRDESGYDKLFKIRPLISIMNDAFQNSALCSTSHAIDECMIKFIIRLSDYAYPPRFIVR